VPFREKHYRWVWDLRAPPRDLWPRISDTDRFNRDCGLPSFRRRAPAPGETPAEPGVRRLAASYLGIVGEWEEREFEWVQPVRFGVERIFSRGPLARMVIVCELSPGKGGGTSLIYEVRIAPRNLLGAALIPVAIGLRMRRDAARVVREYDAAALRKSAAGETGQARTPPRGDTARLASIASNLVARDRQPAPLVGRLCAYVAGADDLSVSKIRPYALADAWGAGRRETLDLFLHATRAGMLDLSWEVLCPHCRGPGQAASSLSDVSADSHCESCGIDFTANFDQSVELTFIPNPSVRAVSRLEYCMGGPQITPHVVAQRRLRPGDSLTLAVTYPDGRYRVRAQGLEVQHAFRVEMGGEASARILVGPGSLPVDEPSVAPGGMLQIVNTGEEARLAVVERVAWSDQSVTAAAVTSRQVFRDLFSREILRHGEKISVGSITIVFTDLKNSTSLYCDIGDAPAFGRVLSHFDTLKAAVAAEGGAVVKTMGDAIMAVFTDPACAVRAMRAAQSALRAHGGGKTALHLKCSINQGPSLAINQNERLDYFGTTVNVAARLCSVSTGSDIVVSERIVRDPAVAALLSRPGDHLDARPDSATLRGLGESPFRFWRVTGTLLSVPPTG
jgi:class 3 adenylate cyclase